MKKAFFTLIILSAALLSLPAQDAFQSLLSDAEKGDWKNFEETMTAAEAVAGGDQEKLQKLYQMWITRCAAMKHDTLLAEKAEKAAADPRLDAVRKMRILADAAKKGKFSPLKNKMPQLNTFLTLCETFTADPKNDPAMRVALAAAMAELIFEQARCTKQLWKNDYYRIIRILEDARSEQTVKDPFLNLLLAAAHIPLNNTLPAESALANVFASKDPAVLNRGYELQGDLYFSKKFYADAFKFYNLVADKSVDTARKMATCAMLDGQLAKAVEALESVREKADEDDRALLEAQIRNLKRIRE